MANPPAPSTGNTAGSALPAAGGTSESTLSSWAGPYVTDMLGKAQAISNTPYQVYGGPMTAGTSGLQDKVFQGLGNLSFPGNLGQSFSSTGAYAPPQMNMGAYNTQPIGTGARAPGSMQDMLNQGSNGFGDFGGFGDGPPKQIPNTPDNLPGLYNLFNQNMQATTGLQNQGPAQPQTYDDYLKDIGDLNVLPQTREQFDAGQKQLGQQRQQGMDMLGRGNMSEIMAGLGGQPGQMPPSGMGGLAGLAGRMPQQQPQQPQGIASQYMNPYLQSVLDPQMAELRRQNEITNMKSNAGMTGAGAFGGGRQAIMNAENNRNLMQEMNKTVGQGYATAYDKGMGQFNIEQGQSKDLVNMLANAGNQQRGIEQEGITADYNEFLAQRDDPMKKLQFQQSMMQGMPYQTITNSPLPKSGMGQLTEIVGSLDPLEKNLRNLGIIP